MASAGIAEWNKWRKQNPSVLPDLRSVVLYGAILSHADFSGAQVGRTIFGNVDLSDTIGLESTQQTEPSTIGLDTYHKSKGKIPEPFLRNAGVPENLIAFLRQYSNVQDL